MCLDMRLLGVTIYKVKVFVMIDNVGIVINAGVNVKN